MKNIVIFGSGFHSKVVFSEVVKLQNYNVLGFVDDFKKKGKKIINYNNKNYFNLGSINVFIKKVKTSNIKIKKRNSRNDNKISGIIGVGFNYLRKKINDEVLKLDKFFKWETIISNDAILNGKVKICEGSLIMSGAIINTHTIIGKHCIINTSSSIDHDNFFNDYSSCAPGVTTGGNVKIGKYSYLGIGSVIKHGIKIGSNTVIGGNSFVNKNCLNNKVYYGVPVKEIKKRKINEKYL